MLRSTSPRVLVPVLPGVALLLRLLAPSPIQAQSAPPAPACKTPPVQVLNPAGTLNLHNGFSGSVDLAGWQPSPDSHRGPVFAPQGVLASPWSGLDFGVGQIGLLFTISVDAIASRGSDVYVGGSFNAVCFNPDCTSGNVVNHIARWNTSGWSGLENGLFATVSALAVSGSDLYAGGDFYSVCGSIICAAGNPEVNYIAKWNGNSWSALGNGLNDTVYALAVSGSDLYAAGSFTEVCGNETCDSGNSPARHIARWNGSSWSGLGEGLDDSVYALAVSGSDLYAGGDFAQICGDGACSEANTPANHVAKWNGSSWSALGNGVSKQPGRTAVNALAVSGTNVYAGGGFKEVCGNGACTIGNTTVNYIAKWDGGSWSGLRDGVDADVNALAITGSDLYVGGNFLDVCGTSECNPSVVDYPVFHIARWDGSFWWDLRYGVKDPVHSLAVGERDLYVGGFFTETCATGGCTPGAGVNSIARYSLPTPLATPTGTFADTATLTPTFTRTPTPSLTTTGPATVTSTLAATATRTPTTAPTPPATSTASAGATPTDTVPASSPSPTGAAVLVGDCAGSGSVSIADLITLVNIALGSQPASTCPHGIPAGKQVDIALLIQGVNNTLKA